MPRHMGIEGKCVLCENDHNEVQIMPWSPPRHAAQNLCDPCWERLHANSEAWIEEQKRKRVQ